MNGKGGGLFAWKDGRKLRCGYTTGSCALGAAVAAAEMLFGDRIVDKAEIHTPKGMHLMVEIQEAEIKNGYACCCVQKDSGDDPDVTNGIKIFAKVSKCGGEGIAITGGAGIGKVTQKGLSVEVGRAAINPVPYAMILAGLKEAAMRHRYQGGLSCEIFAPEGERIAKKTLNEKLGIKGGISILGTSGIVDPMSEDALMETLNLELNVIREKGYQKLLMLPGNYASDYSKKHLHLEIKNCVKYGNFTGYTLDAAAEKGFTDILMVGHIGKLIKNAGGIMQTHSKMGDGRMEIFCCHAALCGVALPCLTRIMKCPTLDAAIEVLLETGLEKIVFQSVADAVKNKAEERTKGILHVECVIFSEQYGFLSQSSGANEMLADIGGGCNG